MATIRESSYFLVANSYLYRGNIKIGQTTYLPGRKPQRQAPFLLPPREGSVGRSGSLEPLAAAAKWLLQRESAFPERLTSGN